MRKLEVMDVVGASTETFTDAIRNAVKQAQAKVARIESMQVGPPWDVVIREDQSLEFRTTVRIIYSREG